MTSKVEQFLAHLDGVRKSGKGWEARCPAHHDSKASLSVAEGDSENVLAFCHAGCGIDSVLSALHLDKTAINGTPRVVAEYPYTRDGRVLYTARRWAPKRFDITPGLPPAAERVLFAEDWISYARKTGEPIYLVEGEKDALALHKQGVPATTAVCGAGSWHSHYADELAGLDVVLVADDDKAGHAFAAAARASLEPCVASLKVRKAKVGNDISDHLDAGFGLDELQPLAERSGLTMFLAADLDPIPVTWAWSQWIPLGAVTLLEGDPGDGKSVLTCDLAATWSTGKALPDGSVNPLAPCDVIMVSAEDDPNMTISPRLRAAGANVRRVHLVVGGPSPDDPFSLATDLAALEREVIGTGAKVVFLDPLMAFLPDTTETSNDMSVRKALGPLSLLARRHGVAVIVVRHLNKGSGKAIYRGGGSIGFIGAARAALMVSPHPDDDNQRVVTRTKNNWGPRDGGLIYSLAPDSVYNVVRVNWEGSLDTSAQEMVDGTEGNSRKDITDVLEHLCADGPHTWNELKVGLEAAGIQHKTAEKYRKRVLDRHIASGGGNRGVFWALKGHFAPGQAPLPAPLRTVKTTPDQPVPPLPPNNNNIYIGGGRGASGQPDDQATEDPVVAEHAREFEVRQRPKVCEVCGQDGVRLLKPYYTVRCRSHHPDVYDHTGSDG